MTRDALSSLVVGDFQTLPLSEISHFTLAAELLFLLSTAVL